MAKDTKTSSLLDLSSDHDILITLVADGRNNHATYLEKFSALEAKVEKVEVGSNATLTEHERRIRALEKQNDEVNPIELQRQATEAYTFSQNAVRDQRNKRTRDTMIITILGIVVSAAVTILVNLSGIFPIKH